MMTDTKSVYDKIMSAGEEIPGQIQPPPVARDYLVLVSGMRMRASWTGTAWLIEGKKYSKVDFWRYGR